MNILDTLLFLQIIIKENWEGIMQEFRKITQFKRS